MKHKLFFYPLQYFFGFLLQYLVTAILIYLIIAFFKQEIHPSKFTEDHLFMIIFLPAPILLIGQFIHSIVTGKDPD